MGQKWLRTRAATCHLRRTCPRTSKKRTASPCLSTTPSSTSPFLRDSSFQTPTTQKGPNLNFNLFEKIKLLQVSERLFGEHVHFRLLQLRRHPPSGPFNSAADHQRPGLDGAHHQTGARRRRPRTRLKNLNLNKIVYKTLN